MKFDSRLLLSCVLLAACSSSEPIPDTAIEGSFAGANPWSSTPGFAMGFSLNIIDGAVSGQGWIGGAGNPLTPLTVVGQFADPEFSLALSAGPTPWGTITGTATTSGLSGTYVMSQGTTPVVMVFVPQDSGAVGRFTGNITGEVSGAISGAAGAGMSDGSFLMQLTLPNANFPVLTLVWPGLRPDVGTYNFNPSQTFSGVVAFGPDAERRYFQVKSGQVRVDVSTRYSFIGELLLQAEEESTRLTVGISSTFSAGCAVQSCQ